MGDAVKTRGRVQGSRHADAGSRSYGRCGRGNALAAWLRRPVGWAAMVLLLTLGATLPGCHSSAPAAPTAKPPAQPVAPAPADGAEAAPEPVQVTGVEVREGAPETTVEITATDPLVWTSFRDATGSVVVELPNSSGRELRQRGAEELRERIGFDPVWRKPDHLSLDDVELVVMKGVVSMIPSRILVRCSIRRLAGTCHTVRRPDGSWR